MHDGSLCVTDFSFFYYLVVFLLSVSSVFIGGPLIFVWFIICVSFICVGLFISGLTILPFSILVLHVAAVVSVCVAFSTLLDGRLQSEPFLKNFVGGKFFGWVGIFFTLCALWFIFNGFFWTCADKLVPSALFVYKSRGLQLVFQKFLFFNSDIVSFFILFEYFFWSLVLLAIFLVIVLVVVDCILRD